MLRNTFSHMILRNAKEVISRQASQKKCFCFVCSFTLAQEDAHGNLQVIILEKIHGVMQRLVVAGQGVFMEMVHQQLLGLVYCACKKEERNNWDCLQAVMKEGACGKQASGAGKCFKRHSKTHSPKASWESAKDMLKGDMMMFGWSGVVSRFCRRRTPSF